MRVLTAIALLAAVADTASASDPTKLRRLLTDSRFLSMVFPCTMGGAKRNSPAEWLRTAFHDAASHDAAAGTGGIDGSIQYEVDYDENKGTTFSTTMTEFKFYQQDDVSLADLVALGATVAVGACAGPVLPYHYGRTDAAYASGTGFVPQPEQMTETHLEMFARMGFSPTEMISLIACGHTIGGVHGEINPALTSDTYHHFDDSHAHFDNRVAVQFVNDSRQNPMGHPWDPSNPAVSSDTRAFAVDNNATINSYAADEGKFINDCRLYSPRCSTRGPVEPFPVSGTLWQSLQNGVLSISSFTASARIYDMVGQWKSFEIGYTNRDGTEGTGGLITAKEVKTISNGRAIEVRDFGTIAGGIPPATGLGSILIKVQLNDGRMYSSAEREEVIKFDDTVLLDLGNLYSCRYSGPENSNAKGMNFTGALLGPYDPKDKVEIIVKNGALEATNLRASYVGPRDAYYNLYNVFIPDYEAIGLFSFGAKVTRADGSVHKDTKDDVYYRLSNIRACVAGATVPTPAPVPSAALSRKKRLVPGQPCPSGFSMCAHRCVDPATNLEHCGGCAYHGGVDCTTISDHSIACIKGKCVQGEMLP